MKKALKKINYSISEQGKIVLSKPRIWLMAFVVFLGYFTYSILSFIPSYIVDVYGVTKEFGILTGYSRNIVQVLGAGLSAFAAYKFKSCYKVIFATFAIQLVSLFLFITIPVNDYSVVIPLINYIVLTMSVYAIKALYFATFDEMKIDFALTGSAAGIVCMVGYLPDTFSYIIFGGLIDNGVNGYYQAFKCGIVACIAGLILSYFAYRICENLKH